MARKPVKKRSKQKQSSLLLPLVAVGALLLVVVGVFVLTRDDDKKENSTSRISPNFTPEVTGAPRIAVPQDVIDLGDVQVNKMVQSEFKIQNVGDQPLRILGEPQVEVVQGC